MAFVEEPQNPARLNDAPEWEAELDDALDHLDVDAIPERARAWQITSTGAAEWAMGKLAGFEKQAHAVREQAATWREPIDEWEADQMKRLKPRIDWFRGHLERYGLAWREENPREATVRLPSGEIATRRGSGSVVSITDEEIVLEWAKAHLDDDTYEIVVKTTEKVKLTEFRALALIVDDDVPFCAGCGAQIDSIPTSTNGGDETIEWRHAGDDGTTVDFDHPAVPVKREVVKVGSEIVLGVDVVPPATTATVKTNR